MMYVLFSVLAAGLLVLDQWSKFWITENLPLGEMMPFWPGIVELRTVHNYGAAWSSLSGKQTLLQAITVILMLAVIYVLVRRIVKHPLGLAAAFLILSGGIGNFIDRVRLGYVVDMFQFEFWQAYPVFNVADMCIVCGAVLGAVYYMWFYEKYDQKKRNTEEVPDGDSDAPTE